MLGIPLQNPARRSGTLVPKLEQLEGREVPALFAIGDIYDVAAGSVLTIPAPQGVLANDFSDTVPGSVLAAQQVQGAKYVGGVAPVPPLPAPNLFLNPDGSFTFIAPPANLIPVGVSQVSFTYNAVGVNTGEISAVPGVVTLNIGAAATKFIATGAGAPGGPHVRVFEAGTSVQRFNFFPYEANFTGGVRVAVGDVNDDGIDDIATIPQTGGARGSAYSTVATGPPSSIRSPSTRTSVAAGSSRSATSTAMAPATSSLAPDRVAARTSRSSSWTPLPRTD